MRRRLSARMIGEYGKANVGMSNDKTGDKPRPP